MAVLGEKVADASRNRARALALKLITDFQTTPPADVALRLGEDRSDGVRTARLTGCDDVGSGVRRASPVEQLYAVREARRAIAPAYAFYVLKRAERFNIEFTPVLEAPSAEASFRERCNDAALLTADRVLTSGDFSSSATHVAYVATPMVASLALAALMGPAALLGLIFAPIVGSVALCSEPKWSASNQAHVAWADKALADAEPALAAFE